MKKIFFLTLFIIIIAIILLSLIGCVENQTFVIQYFDGGEIKNLKVKVGMPYSLERIPEIEGHTFTGLFDSEVGGTQYVSAQGASLAPFSDLKNLVLFPQFVPKKYTIVLDYQGGPVTGVREITITYGARIQSLPLGLVVENKEFMGWYTQPNCEGLQIADAYGTIPSNAIVTSRIFDLSDQDGFIHIYAGFRGEMHTVTFYFKDGMAPEEVEAEYGTPISEIILDYRDENGFAVLEWTQDSTISADSTVFTGEVTRDMTLYAKTYAPVIEFEENGGCDLIPLVQTAGKKISLPTPVRNDYEFLYWENENGEKINYLTMPAGSVTLYAVWLDKTGESYIIQFSDDMGIHQIKVSSGEPYYISRIPLKTGYDFLGLYDREQGGTQYINSAGSSVGVFTDNVNIVLYPQFSPKIYTISLDYGGAEQSGAASTEATYDEILPQLPPGLRLENKVFTGWYTRPGGAGTKVADEDGNILGGLKFTDELFDITSSQVKLYAGFTWETYEVRFEYPNEQPVIVSVEYGTDLADIRLPERADGKAVTQWRKLGENTPFSGTITGPLTLTPAKWSWSISGSRTNDLYITDDGYNEGKNAGVYDKVFISDLFGKTLDELKSNNGDINNNGFKFTTASIKIVLTVREVDDGYQWIKICSTNSGSDLNTLFEQKFEHGAGKKDKTSYSHTFSFNVNISDISDQINIYYDGEGDFSDDWVCESMNITITLYN